MGRSIQSAISCDALHAGRYTVVMSVHSTIGITAAILSLIDFGLYILSIYGRDHRLRRLPTATVPNRATWFTWAALGTVTAASYVASGATDTAWFAIAYAVGFIAIALLSIKYGEGGFTWTDRACLIGALLSAVMWWKFNTPEVALYATLAIDFFGAIPTLKKSWLEPKKENRLAWSVTAIATGLNVLALNWRTATLPLLIYPLYMLMVNGTIVALLYRKNFLAKNHS